MFLDVPEERGLSVADLRWGVNEDCRFPLFNFMRPLSLHWMIICYLFMWLGEKVIINPNCIHSDMFD